MLSWPYQRPRLSNLLSTVPIMEVRRTIGIRSALWCVRKARQSDCCCGVAQEEASFSDDFVMYEVKVVECTKVIDWMIDHALCLAWEMPHTHH